jgi:hypothetical protein
MNGPHRFKLFSAITWVALVFHSESVFACAACFGGKSDSPLAAGMNWGIFSLMGVVVCVLGGIATFFVYLAKRAAMTAPPAPQGEMPDSTQKA